MAVAALPVDRGYAGRFRLTASATTALPDLAPALKKVLGPDYRSAPGVLQACLEVAARLRVAEGWSPADVLDELRDRIHATVAKSHQKKIGEQVDYTDRVLAMETRLDLGESRLSDDALTAMLVFLLHPIPSETVEWTASEGVKREVAVLAAAYTGIASGIARLSTEFKTPRLLHCLTAWYLDALGLPGRREAVTSELTARFEPTRDIGGRLEVVLGDDVVTSRERSSVTDLLLATDLRAPLLSTQLVDLCRFLGWDNCIINEMTIVSDDGLDLRSVKRLTLLEQFLSGLRLRLIGEPSGAVVRFKGRHSERCFPDEAALRAQLEQSGLSMEAAMQFRESVVEWSKAHPATTPADPGVS